MSKDKISGRKFWNPATGLVFMQLVEKRPDGSTHTYYMVGKNPDAILNDDVVNQSKLDSYQLITEKKLRELNVGLIDEGIRAICQGTASYLLKGPR